MIIWKTKQEKYSNGENGYVGPYKFFSISYTSFRGPNDNKCWRLNCSLPGIKTDLGKFEKKEQGKSKADMVLDMWLKKTGLSKTKEQ
jgi:hypothetical protein